MRLLDKLFGAPRPDLVDSIRAAEDRRHSLDPFDLPSEGCVIGPAKRKYKDGIDRFWAENSSA